MLKSKSVAKIIQDALNLNDKDEHFKIFDSAGDYKATDINGVLKQNKATIVPTLNYINANVPYSLELIVPMQCGEDRLDTIVNIVNKAIKTLNGKVKEIDRGKAIFLFDTIDMGGLETRATAGQSLKLGLSFSVEYSNKDVGTRYEIALIDNAFSGTINTRYFESQEEQAKWYEDQVDKGTWNDLLSPNINALVLSQQRYTNDTGVDVNELLMYNYAIIRETKEDGTKNYYYYDITNANVNTNNIIILDLKMDTLQTWYFNPEIKFDDCFVERADINRFIEVDSNIVRFDTRPESELFEREDIQNVTKRLVKRDVINPNEFSSSLTLDTSVEEWTNENILGWCYLYLSSNYEFKIGSIGFAKNEDEEFRTRLKPLQYLNKSWNDTPYVFSGSLWNTLCCVAFPVLKSNKKMYIAELQPDSNLENPQFTDKILEFSSEGLIDFLRNNSADYVYAMKFSQVSPVPRGNSSIILDSNKRPTGNKNGDLYFIANKRERTYKIDNVEYTYEPLGILDDEFELVDAISCSPTHRGDYIPEYGMFNVLRQNNINIKFTYLQEANFKFLKNEITNSKHNMVYNPKLLSSDYASIILSDNLQNGAEYDPLKLGKGGLTISYTEALTPDITKKYIRFSELDGYYIPETAENLTGYVSADDTAFILESSAYQSMLANNKNFFLQNAIDRGDKFARTTFSGFGKIADMGLNMLNGGGWSGLASGVMGLAVDSANLVWDREVSLTNEKLTVDNLKNAPNSINGAKGNVIFNSMYSEMGIVVEWHEIIPHEKKMVDDRINLYGMTLNKVANIKDYDNKRRYHNYIKADIDGIYGIPISNAIKNDIRQRFSAGVRFWNKNKQNEFAISYEEENYERWLEG